MTTTRRPKRILYPHPPAELTAHPLLFTISTNTPLSSLPSLVTALPSFLRLAASDAYPQRATPTLSLPARWRFFRKEDATPFRSDILGRPERQFGGWHAMRNKGKEEVVQRVKVGLTESVDWEKIWSRSPEGNILPLALRGLRRKDVHTITTLTDNAPQGLNKSLSSFPHATKLGLFGSSTPFATGRPYILLYDGSVNSSGAVGIALSAGPRPTLQTTFHGLRAITEPLKVTRSEGNLVNELDNVNLTTLLISAIEKSALTG
ncbi:hypothetical protein BGW80DRAFT_1466469 [Lactifluus volemus]|nr:hypothetical protein BGW80DRAFT_1466469 [Lactifluus volemus]